MSIDPARSEAFALLRRASGVRLGLVAAAMLLLAAGWAAPALAIPAAGAVPTSALGEILCGPPDGCDGLAVPDAARDFDFELGARPTATGLHLEVETEGSVFLLGPVRATGDITLRATGGSGTIDLEGTLASLDPRSGRPGGLDPGDITLEVRDLILLDPDRVPLVVSPPGLVIAPPPAPPSFSGGSGAGTIVIGAGPGRLSIDDVPDSPGSAGADIRLSGGLVQLGDAGAGSLRLVAGATSTDDPPPSEAPASLLTWSLSAEGDVFLDLSGIELASLDVLAKKRITVADASSNPVPEPTTALLFGLGLAGLAARRATLG